MIKRAMNEPNSENSYLGKHAELLISSYRRLTGKDLVKKQLGVGFDVLMHFDFTLAVEDAYINLVGM
jgi:hypothetical protein